MEPDGRTPGEILAEAASYYWEVAEVDIDKVDPDDHVAVLKAAFTESHCDDLAWMINRMTGWPTVRASYQMPGWGWGHHTMVRAPDGRLLDVRGWADEATAARRCCRRKDVLVTFSECEPKEPQGMWADDEGHVQEAARLAAVVRSLPHAPFRSKAFQEISMRPLEGVDVPLPEDGPAPGP